MKKILIKKEILKKLYFDKKLSLNQISKILKISNCTIESRLKEYGFKLRNKWEAKKLINQSGKNNYFYLDGRCLKKYYCKDCKKEIIYKTWRYGKQRCSSCSHIGDKNYLFGKERPYEVCCKLSLSFGGNEIPYSQNEYPKNFYYIKETIRQRDNYECQNCSMTEEEHLIVHGQVLHVHHIDYDKQNCNKENLISLCHNCNIRANYNRTYWQEFYTKINSQVD